MTTDRIATVIIEACENGARLPSGIAAFLSASISIICSGGIVLWALSTANWTTAALAVISLIATSLLFWMAAVTIHWAAETLDKIIGEL